LINWDSFKDKKPTPLLLSTSKGLSEMEPDLIELEMVWKPDLRVLVFDP
jgi:hypothetical protein